MSLEPNPLFDSRKEVFGFLIAIVLFLALHVSFIYAQYGDFVDKGRHVVQGVLVKYEKRTSKHNKPYALLHVKSPEFLLYTVSWDEALHVRVGQYLNLTIVSENLTFKDYLSKRFFAPSFGHYPLRKSEDTMRQKLYSFIAAQHESPKLQNLFGALFLGLPVGLDLRQDITHWGIAHLIAISGFHLGVLMLLGYGVLNPIYSFFQGRYFPYRNRHLDIGLALFGFAFFYMWLIDFTPSFLRSWVMGAVGFWLLYRHVKLLSFSTLGVCVAILLVLFPSLLFHIGFLFSVLGVFYIFLYLHHFKDLIQSKWLHGVLLNIWVFLGMVIPVHFWFGLNTFQQFSAIPLSLFFIIFYPLAGVLHVMGFGGVMDGVLEQFLSLRFGFEGSFITPYWMMLGYLVLSFLAIWNKLLAICVIMLGFIPFVFVQITA